MKKIAVFLVTCVIALSVIEMAQAQLLRRGSVSRLRGGGNSGCCQYYSCPTSSCQAASWRQPPTGFPSGYCEAAPAYNPCYRASIEQNQSRYWSVGCCPQAVYTILSPCAVAPGVSLSTVTPYQACCSHCRTNCPGAEFNKCIAFCDCEYSVPRRPNCTPPSCF